LLFVIFLSTFLFISTLLMYFTFCAVFYFVCILFSNLWLTFFLYAGHPCLLFNYFIFIFFFFLLLTSTVRIFKITACIIKKKHLYFLDNGRINRPKYRIKLNKKERNSHLFIDLTLKKSVITELKEDFVHATKRKNGFDFVSILETLCFSEC